MEIANYHIYNLITCLLLNRFFWILTEDKITLDVLTPVKVEGVKCRATFMSARDSLFLGSIGLLGEYFPTSRKKYICSSEKSDYLQLEPFQETYNLNQNCNSEQFFIVVTSQYGIEENRKLISTSVVWH